MKSSIIKTVVRIWGLNIYNEIEHIKNEEERNLANTYVRNLSISLFPITYSAFPQSKEQLDFTLKVVQDDLMLFVQAEKICASTKIRILENLINTLCSGYYPGLCKAVYALWLKGIYNSDETLFLKYLITRAKREFGISPYTGFVWSEYDRKPRIEYLTKLINEIQSPLKIE